MDEDCAKEATEGWRGPTMLSSRWTSIDIHPPGLGLSYKQSGMVGCESQGIIQVTDNSPLVPVTHCSALDAQKGIFIDGY